MPRRTPGARRVQLPRRARIDRRSRPAARAARRATTPATGGRGMRQRRHGRSARLGRSTAAPSHPRRRRPGPGSGGSCARSGAAGGREDHRAVPGPDRRGDAPWSPAPLRPPCPFFSTPWTPPHVPSLTPCTRAQQGGAVARSLTNTDPALRRCWHPVARSGDVTDAAARGRCCWVSPGPCTARAVWCGRSSTAARTGTALSPSAAARPACCSAPITGGVSTRTGAASRSRLWGRGRRCPRPPG